MNDMNRRDMCVALAAFAAVGSTLHAQNGSAGSGSLHNDAAVAPAPDLRVAGVYRFAEMKVSYNANGGSGRQILRGTLPTGEFVEARETMLPAGQMPHPPHRHRNTEFIMVREGMLEFQNEGHPEPVGPGDVIYTASNKLHGLKNVGTTPALYFVVSISHGQE